MLGHINHSSYFVYMEEARFNFLTNLGINVDINNFTFVLASTKCDFIRQGNVGQFIQVQTEVTAIGRTSLTLTSELIEKESGSLVAKGKATIVYFDVANQKAAKLPDSFRSKLEYHLLAQ